MILSVWPQFPKSAKTLKFASAEQGSMRGDYAIAWRFEGLPKNESQYDSAVVNFTIRLLVPPTGEASLRFAVPQSSSTTATFHHAVTFPDLGYAKSEAKKDCEDRRRQKLGFSYNWDYDRVNENWFKRLNGKAIGTPCDSFLFHPSLDNIVWSATNGITGRMKERTDEYLPPGLYEVIINNWQLEKEVEGSGRIGNIPEYFNAEGDISPYCSDKSDFEWNIEDATHII